MIGLAVLLAARFALKPPLEISPPALSVRGETCTVSFSATNNSNQPIRASLLVVAGCGTRGGQSAPPRYVEVARETVSVRLWPKESKRLSCEFPLAGRSRPNTARIEIVSFQ
ncbi:MAG: hypothetical protein ABMA13_22365 [Chthoniobacteraceae bacterium]